MDIRTFILGAATGIAACTLIYWLVDGRQDGSVPVTPPERTALAGTAADRTAMERDGRVELVSPSNVGGGDIPAPRPEAGHGPELQSAPADYVVQSTRSQGPAADAEQGSNPNQDTSGSVVDTSPAARADRLKEPRDPSWSYYMEQTLRQYLASHARAAQFDFTSVDCRTTFCEVRAFGFDESTEPVWVQVMYDVKQQPWSEFGQYGTASGREGGRLVLIGTFHRLPRK